MTYIFIDTNIFLHFQDFRKIDWLYEASVKNCTLVVPPIVIDELDEKKIGTNRIGKKARQILNHFEEILDKEKSALRNNVSIEIILEKPLKSVYDDNELNFEEQDHRLIASIIAYSNKNNVSDILLCTYDIGPRLRAAQFGIKALKLDVKYLLPNQQSDEEKKIKKLEFENAKLKNRIPKLNLRFSNQNEFIKLDLPSNPNIGIEEFKTKKLEALRLEYKHLEPESPKENTHETFGIDLSKLDFGLTLTKDQINSYNNSLDAFFVDYEKVLDKIYIREKRQNLTYKIELILQNHGSIPADDIDIHIHFPDGFELFDSPDNDEVIKLPKPPFKPKNRWDFGLTTLAPEISYIHPQVKVGGNFNFNSPTIKKTNSYDVDYSRKSLKHGYIENLEVLSIMFADFNHIKNFNIDYEISAGNMPDIVKGQLNVIFQG